MAFFCISMALLYALCAENSVPVTDAIFGVRARTRAQPRTHSVIKVCHRSSWFSDPMNASNLSGLVIIVPMTPTGAARRSQAHVH